MTQLGNSQNPQTDKVPKKGGKGRNGNKTCVSFYVKCRRLTF